MRLHPLSILGERLVVSMNNRNARMGVFWLMVVLGVILGIATFASLGGLEGLSGRKTLRAILVADFIYALMVATFVGRHLAAMIAARRRQSAGSRLHVRLVRMFTALAIIPTVLVAIFATITLNFGLEGWFSDRVRDVVSNSLAAAQAYEEEHTSTLTADTRVLAQYISDQKRRYPLLSGGGLRETLTNGQIQMQRALSKAYIIDGDGTIRARGERSYLFYYSRPLPEELERARNGELVIIQDWENNEFRALVELERFSDHFLFVSREVDGEILGLLDETQETVLLYQQLEKERGSLLFEFALIYLGFALVVILGAMWMGMWFAERLARPVGRLASAAERVGSGDFNVRVREAAGDDEIALLGQAFNKMTRQVKGQRDALVSAHQDTERRRRLFDSVLSSVTAGVIGLGDDCHVEVMNTAASDLLDLEPEEAIDRPLEFAVPEFMDLQQQLQNGRINVVKGEIKLRRHGREKDLLVRMAKRNSNEGDLEGYVISFDDVTDLVAAQRLAAWGDVARRIAHEVKNPLTPIQLSAERIRRKFGPKLGDDQQAMVRMTDVIIRQTDDLRRIVDEFSKFARMPAPDRKALDLTKLVEEAVLLQENGRPDIRYVTELPDHAVLAQLDSTMISQALTNLMKNAAEAVDDRIAEMPQPRGQIMVRLVTSPEHLQIEIEDNGSGLPDAASRLFEPYVTNREKGTGLGLSIVKKIIEEHDGTLELLPSNGFEDGGPKGALAKITLPHVRIESPAGEDRSEKEKITEKLRERIK